MSLRRAPFDAGPAGEDALPERPRYGRATVRALEDGRELFRLGGEDATIARRLLALGEANVGGFVDGARDERGPWLVRDVRGTALAERLRDRQPWPAPRALGVARMLARALAACEAARLFPGPLAPETVLVRGDGELAVTLRAEGLVGALLGAAAGDGARAGSEVAPLWTPPAQADGAPWDAAANRYALGLLVYRLLSGEHAFGGAGLRHALAEAARTPPPPFEPAIAQALPPGLQSFCLAMLDPDEAARPCGSKEIEEALARFEGGERGREAGSASGREREREEERGRERARRAAAERAPSPLPARPPTPSAPRARHPADAAPSPSPAASATRWLLRAAPLAIGLAVAGAALALASPPPAAPHQAPTVPAAAALTVATTTAADCAHCHARQAAEWRRSVMAHAVESPLFNALESLIEEQVGRDEDCPGGAGILRRADARACRDRTTGLPVTGSGGEHWCVNCHAAATNVGGELLPAWDGLPGGDPRTRRPVRDLLGARAMEGISCGFCHTVHGPVGARGSRGYVGNATWTSFLTGAVFSSRPEDARGQFGIANSGYLVHTDELLLGGAHAVDGGPGVHRRPSDEARSYLGSSQFCGSCHDVRLFGTDVLGVAKGEHFKRLRNAYSEWSAWAGGERRANRKPASCQDCHMSTFPGVCEPGDGAGDDGCPKGSHFVARAPGQYPEGRVAETSAKAREVVTHYFTGVDFPLARELDDGLLDAPTLDLDGIPLGYRQRRDLLLKHTFRFAIDGARRAGDRLEIPIAIENVGAGHRVPAGFSQEREVWVELTVRDGDGRVVYEVGHLDRQDEDLRDKVFARVNVRGDDVDARGRPLGLFGADVRDGPDVPAWSPPPASGGTRFRGRGLVTFQNGFFRCVRCIGTIAADGTCEPGPGQGVFRADRFDDGAYDPDTGECRSNLAPEHALFETYFPVGALDASRGVLKGPDAILDTRSAPPGVPLEYTYDLPVRGRRGPFRVEARLLFRAFPPYLVRAFAAYEREQTRRRLRPSGPLVTDDALRRLEIVELSHATAEIAP